MKRIGLLTSGGDCQALNATMRGVVKGLSSNLSELEVYGFMNGYKGLIYGDYRLLTSRDFSGILTKGGTILGSSRQPFKLMREPDEKGLDKVEAMKQNYYKLRLDCLVILGGNGTQKSAKLIADAGMNVITLPKTIDNDIFGTDTTFGFQSAVDVATNVIDYIHSTASSHSRIFVVELMGRDAGWLTLHAGIGSGADVILIPEIPYDINKVAALIESRKKKGRSFSIVACAEGAVSADKQRLDEETSRRLKELNRHPSVSYEIAEQLEKLTGQEARVTVPGHYQRGGPPCAYDRVLATQFGAAAAELIMSRQYGRMVAVQGGKIVSIPLEEAASKTKFLPTDHAMIRVARDIGICFGD